MTPLVTLDIVLLALAHLVRKELEGVSDPTVTLGEVYTSIRGRGRPNLIQVRAVLDTFLPSEMGQDQVRVYRLPWLADRDTRFTVKRS